MIESRELPAALVRALADEVGPRQHAAGEVLCECGDAAEHLMVVERGEVELYLPLGGCADLPVARLTAGQFFGELALGEVTRRTVSARALRPSRVVAVGAEALQAFVRRHPDAAALAFGSASQPVRSEPGS